MLLTRLHVAACSGLRCGSVSMAPSPAGAPKGSHPLCVHSCVVSLGRGHTDHRPEDLAVSGLRGELGRATPDPRGQAFQGWAEPHPCPQAVPVPSSPTCSSQGASVTPIASITSQHHMHSLTPTGAGIYCCEPPQEPLGRGQRRGGWWGVEAEDRCVLG